MEYARVGDCGLVVSRLGLGMMSFWDTSRRAWHLDAAAAEPLVRAAAEAGVTLFDTADVYDAGASEVVTGRLLASIFSSRDKYVLATKVYYPTGDVAPIVGVTRPGHQEDAVAALDVELSEDEVRALEAPYRPHRVLGLE